MTLFRIESDPPAVQVDVIYATPDNFMGRTLYDAPIFALVEDAAKSLKRAVNQLKKRGYGVLLWDGYRPFSVQALMWDLIQDERFVSNPYTMGGRHTRGTAVDLTLTDNSGHPLQMPTSFDDLSEKAGYAFKKLPPEVIERRELLRSIMEEAGFAPLSTEWWHFDLVGWEKYPTQNVSLSSLQNAPIVKL